MPNPEYDSPVAPLELFGYSERDGDLWYANYRGFDSGRPSKHSAAAALQEVEALIGLDEYQDWTKLIEGIAALPLKRPAVLRILC